VIITALAVRATHRIRRLIYWNASVPNDGESVRDMLPPQYVDLFHAIAAERGDGCVVLPFPIWRERLLRAHGFHPECFASAEAFLAREGLGPACLVLDVQLGGMSGIALRHHLQALGSRLPIIFITALTDEATRQKATERPCSGAPLGSGC
jgi:hypothetical protein